MYACLDELQQLWIKAEAQQKIQIYGRGVIAMKDVSKRFALEMNDTHWIRVVT